MREVAALAGVSLATVSRTINGEPGVQVELAERVREAVALLGYRRDLTATALRRADRLSASIGLVSQDVSSTFNAAVHRGIEQVALTRGVLTFAASSDLDPYRERELALGFCGRRIDGLILEPSINGDQSYLAPERAGGLPLVFIDHPPSLLEGDLVVSDNAGGAQRATAHLLSGGHRRIGYLGEPAPVFTSTERLRGYREALADHGVAFDASLVFTDLSTPEASAEATRTLLERSDAPSAIFSTQALLTVGALRTLRAMALHHVVALVAFDDFQLADMLDPGLTAVSQNALELGRHAAELLFARLDGDKDPFKRLVLPPTLIQRGSGEIPPRAS